MFVNALTNLRIQVWFHCSESVWLRPIPLEAYEAIVTALSINRCWLGPRVPNRSLKYRIVPYFRGKKALFLIEHNCSSIPKNKEPMVFNKEQVPFCPQNKEQFCILRNGWEP